MKYRTYALLITALMALAIIPVFAWTLKCVYTKTIVVHALAVSDGKGEVLDINVTVVKPGRGYVYVASKPLPIGQSGTFIASSQVAALIATYLANKSFLNYDFLITVNPKAIMIGGPSASAYVAVAMWALLTNRTLRNGVTMTGMILPDGLIGPVGGVPEKVKAAAEAGFKVVLIPYVERYVYEDGRLIDMVKYGRELGVKVIPVADIEDAIKYFTGIKIGGLKVKPKDVRNEAFIKMTEYLWKCLEKRIVDSNAINDEDPKVRALIEEAYEQAKNGHYYTAASLGFQALIRHYMNVLSGYSPSELRAIAERLRQELEDIRSRLKGVRATLEDMDVLAGIYDRLRQGEELLKKAEGLMGMGYYAMAIDYLAQAKARIETIYDWLGLLLGIEGRHEIPQKVLRDLTSIYVTYAESVYDYALTLSSAVGPIQSADIEALGGLVEKAKEEFASGRYVEALSTSLEAIARGSSTLHRLCAVTGEEYLRHVINVLYEATLRDVYKVEKCGVIPLLSLSYAELAKYDLEKGNLEAALRLLELASSYAKALYELTLSSGLCGRIIVSPPRPIQIEAKGTNRPIRQSPEISYALLTVSISLLAAALALAVVLCKRWMK